MVRLFGPVARARFYGLLVDWFGQQRTAAILRTSRANVANTVRLLQLEPEILDLVRARRLNAGAARALLAVDDRAERLRLAHRAASHAWSVRRVEQEAACHG